jgi:hypothetical protein
MPEEPGNGGDNSDDVDETVEAALARAAAGLPAVTALNQQAGDHSVTTDPRELRSAMRAGNRTQQRFAYYERR